MNKNNEIFNPQTEVPPGIKLNDQDYLNQLLTTLKELEKNYVVAMTESSNAYLYNQIYQIFQELTCLQRETYELMFKNGWYKLEIADKNKLSQKHQTLKQELDSLNL